MKRFSEFSSELRVRPDDLDINNHVHTSKYIDYVLAARYDQMREFYRMPMEEFLSLGYSWVVTKCSVEFKRPLLLGETIVVTTGIEEVGGSTAKVKFAIHKKQTGKLSAEGTFEYAMVNRQTGKPETIPASIVEKYSI